jgi:hypothetical protein
MDRTTFKNDAGYPMVERRREQRYEAGSGAIDVLLLSGQDAQFVAQATIREISRSGACIHMPVQLDVGATARIVTNTTVRDAVVRHCAKANWGFLIGLEFCTPSAPDPSQWLTVPAMW